MKVNINLNNESAARPCAPVASAPDFHRTDAAALDFSAYTELQRQIIALVRSGKSNTVECRELWRQSEVIKNRHGGMPPTI